MFDRYEIEFSNYFGSVFKIYVGQILQHGGRSIRLISEKEIRHKYPAEMVRLADWIVVDGNQAILIERQTKAGCPRNVHDLPRNVRDHTCNPDQVLITFLLRLIVFRFS